VVSWLFFFMPSPSPKPSPKATNTTNTRMMTPKRYFRGIPHVFGAFSSGSSDTRRGTGSPFSSNSSGWKPDTTVESSIEYGEPGLCVASHGPTTSGASCMTSFEDAGLFHSQPRAFLRRLHSLRSVGKEFLGCLHARRVVLGGSFHIGRVVYLVSRVNFVQWSVHGGCHVPSKTTVHQRDSSRVSWAP